MVSASISENPNGFRAFQEPIRYIATRMECVCEIALFLSIVFFAFLFHPRRVGFAVSDWRSIDTGIVLSGITALCAMFLSGAYQTGEAARAAMFIYPYLLLTLKNADSIVITDILVFSGLQTAAMQLLGGYNW